MATGTWLWWRGQLGQEQGQGQSGWGQGQGQPGQGHRQEQGQSQEGDGSELRAAPATRALPLGLFFFSPIFWGQKLLFDDLMTSPC